MSTQPNETEEQIEVVIEDDSGQSSHEPIFEDDEIPFEELAELSPEHQEKFRELSDRVRDGRPALETARRDAAQAKQFAQQVAAQGATLHNETEQLKAYAAENEPLVVQTGLANIYAKLKLAKTALQEARDFGDLDKEIEAQEQASRLTNDKARLEQYQPVAYRPQYVRPPVQQPVQVEPSERASRWQEENSDWYRKNSIMTSAALGVHAELVSKGYDPESKEYYKEIDTQMRENFPERFKQRASKRKVTLTKRQADLSKRLGVPLEAYADKEATLEPKPHRKLSKSERDMAKRLGVPEGKYYEEVLKFRDKQPSIPTSIASGRYGNGG